MGTPGGECIGFDQVVEVDCFEKIIISLFHLLLIL